MIPFSECRQGLVAVCNYLHESAHVMKLFHIHVSHLLFVEPSEVQQMRNLCTVHYLYALSRIVCVGGDGMFSEILHGLVTRIQTDNGVDQNQQDAKLLPCGLRIGIIPAGELWILYPIKTCPGFA